MSDTIKIQKIFNNLAAAYRLIVAGATYYRTIVTVTDSRPKPFEVSECPAINLVEDETAFLEIGTEAPYDRQNIETMIEVNLSVAGETIAQVREHIADIYKSTGANITLGGYSINISPMGHQIIREQDNQTITGVKIRLKVLYQTGLFQES